MPERVPNLEIFNIYVDLSRMPDQDGVPTVDQQRCLAQQCADDIFRAKTKGSRLKAFAFGRNLTFWDELPKWDCVRVEIPRQWFVPIEAQSSRTHDGDGSQMHEEHAAVRLKSGLQEYVVPACYPNVGILNHKIDF